MLSPLLPSVELSIYFSRRMGDFFF
ncbi:IQ calmodulin-binding motif containing 1 (predicted), isoform CRA_f, partial [Rattus norvegicus]